MFLHELRPAPNGSIKATGDAMAQYPAATWRGPVPNRRPGGMQQVHGLVLHVEQGSESGTDAWFHNAAAQASSHFGNPKTGPLDQWVDTADEAWAQSAGNPHWISVEHEGRSGDVLTPSQLENDAQLLAWLHSTYAVPLTVTDDPDGAGLGWHGMGGQAWGGHLDCPGEPIKNARPAVIARAIQIFTPPPPVHQEDEDMAVLIRCASAPGDHATYAHDGHLIYPVDGPTFNAWVAAGAKVVGVSDAVFALYASQVSK